MVFERSHGRHRRRRTGDPGSRRPGDDLGKGRFANRDRQGRRQEHEHPFAWSFRKHVEPILAKQGCNSGACHGALAGKGGFKLSLQGYDPAADYFNIVKQDRGRRVELADPGQSLFLAKPSGAIAHKGGVRFGTGSPEYRVLSEWISGAKPLQAATSRASQLEILPSRSFQKVGDSQQILVRARYSDGGAEDVTRWVKWSSADESVCRVDDRGTTQVIGPGEGAIVAWYASKLAIARVTVPYPRPADQAQAPAPERKPRNFIDEQIDKQLARSTWPRPRRAATPSSPAAPTSTRSAGLRPSTKPGASWAAPTRPAAMHSSTACSPGPSSPITGPTSGRTC